MKIKSILKLGTLALLTAALPACSFLDTDPQCPPESRFKALAGTGDSNVPLTAAAAALAAAGAGLVAYSVRRTALEKDTANEVNSDRPR